MIIGNTTSTYSSLSAVTSPKPKSSRSDSFADVLTTTHEHEAQPASQDSHSVNFGVRVNMFMAESAIADNGVKSAVQEAQSTGTMTTIKLTKEEADAWDNGKTPEGLRFTNAGGVIFSGGTRKYDADLGVYYTDGADYDY